MTARTVAIIQARMGSTRLPGKVLRPLAGLPMILQVVRRARAIPGVDEVVVATSVLPDEEPLVTVLRSAGIPLARGSPDDVLSRYLLAGREHRAEVVVRITSDCPLLDPGTSGRVVAAWHTAPDAWDYISNTQVRTFPRGLDTEVFAFAGLERCDRDGRTPAEREHVTPHFYLNPGRFRVHQVTDPVDRNTWRWTVDTPEDLAFAEAVYAALPADAGYAEIVRFIEAHPQIAALNAHVQQKPLSASTRPR